MILKNLVALVTFCFITLVTISPKSLAQQSIFDTSASSLFSNEDEFLTPEKAFNFNFDQKNTELNVTFDIADGYYLYKKQFKFNGDNIEFVAPTLPIGIDHEDEFFGKQQIYTQQLTFTIPLTLVNQNGTISIRYQGCAEAGLCFPPIIKTIELSTISSAKNASSNTILTAISANKKEPLDTGKISESEQHQLADMLAGNNIWLTLVAFFVGGLLLSFTPCVFPMYPILTGIIVGQKKELSTKRAFSLSFFYVQGMAITYTLLGIVVALAGAKFQAMFQHPVVLIALSILFVFLALSMFGVFNLALPSSWQNKLNNLSNSQKGGSYWGVFIMGAISGLVASPCTTAPLTGALLYISQSGDIALGASALYALSLGMGLPLLILGSTSGKLLPKAGNWMNIIKNIFGLLLLVVPVFLLDRFLPTHISATLWLVWILASSYYFMNINLNTKRTAKNYLFAVIIIALTVFSIFKVFSFYPIVNQQSSEQHDMFTQVDNLSELQLLIKKANADGKTVMVDLYADWCIACKEFEKYTFSDKSVQHALNNTVLVQIDLTDMGNKHNKEFMAHFNVLGLPSILFFDLTGQELVKSRITGFMAAPEFATHINHIFKQ